MAQDSLPFRSLRQPVSRSTPGVGPGYSGRQINLGDALRGRLTPGPSAGAGMARVAQGFDALAQGVSKVVAVAQSEELDRQKVDAVNAITDMQTQEREVFDQISQTGGLDARNSSTVAQEFYDKKEKELTESARGDYQFMVYKNTLASMRAAGLDKAKAHERQAAEVYKEQTWVSSQANGAEQVARDPSSLPRIKADLVQQDRLLHPDLPPEAYIARESEIDSNLLTSTVEGVVSGDAPNKFEAADEIVEVARQPVNVPAGAQQWLPLIQESAEEYGVPASIIMAVMQGESNFKSGAVSKTGVRGLMQVTGDTYKALGFTGDRSDPRNSVRAGTKLLGQLYQQYGSWEDALADYNGGPDAVKGLRTGKWGQWAGNAAKQREIKNYAPTVLGNMNKITGGQGAGSDPRTIGKLKKYIQSERNFWDNSAKEGAKALIDGQVDAINNARATGYVDPNRTRSILDNPHISDDQKNDLITEIDVNQAGYNTFNANEAAFKSIETLRQEMANLYPQPEALNPGEEMTAGYRRQLAAFQYGQNLANDEYNRYVVDPIGYSTLPAIRVAETMKEMGLITEDQMPQEIAKQAMEISRVKGGLTPVQASLSPAISNETIANIQRQFDEVAGDARGNKQLLQGIKNTYGPLYPKVLADVGRGHEDIIAENFGPTMSQYADLAYQVGPIPMSHWSTLLSPAQRTNAETLINDTMFNAEATRGAGFLQVTEGISNARFGDQHMSDINLKLKEVMYKMAYELARRNGGELKQSDITTMRDALNSQNQTIIDKNLAYMVVPNEYNVYRVTAGMTVVRSAMGRDWSEMLNPETGQMEQVTAATFFRNHDDKIMIDRQDGEVLEFTFDELAELGKLFMVYGQDTMGMPDPYGRSGMEILLGRAALPTAEQSIENKPMSYEGYQTALEKAAILIDQKKRGEFGPPTEEFIQSQVVSDIATGAKGPLPQPAIVKRKESRTGVETTEYEEGTLVKTGKTGEVTSKGAGTPRMGG